jgi:hypothetical protein
MKTGSSAGFADLAKLPYFLAFGIMIYVCHTANLCGVIRPIHTVYRTKRREPGRKARMALFRGL